MADDKKAEKAELKTMLAQLKKQMESIENKLTEEEGTAVTPLPVPSNPELSLDERIRLALTAESLDAKQLVKVVKEPLETIEQSLKELRTQGKIFNMGHDDHQRWTWRVGDGVETVVLRDIVKRLISERPMSLRDLVSATGVKNFRRVSGVMIDLQRVHDIIDISGGDTHAKIYFLVSDKVQSAKLQKKIVERKHPGEPSKKKKN